MAQKIAKQDAYSQLLDGLYEANATKVGEALKRGAPAGDRTLSGYSMLMRAAGTGNVYIVRRILDGGGKVNGKDENGYTALSIASGNGYNDIIEFLLKNGAEINAADKDGNTALIRAVYYPETVRTLIKHNAGIDLQNNKGETALMIAAEYGKLDSVKILLENGANPEITDGRGWDASKWASEERREIISEYVKKFKIMRSQKDKMDRRNGVEEILADLGSDMKK